MRKKERICELEDRIGEINESEQKKKTRLGGNDQSFRDTWNNF
jgi:hypothetical protein